MKFFNSKFNSSNGFGAGFTLAEMVVGSAVFAIIAVTVFQTYSTFINLVALGKYKILATDIVNEQFELVRNLKYADVGIIGSIPSGVLSTTTNVVKNGFTFTISRTIRNIDDPFDGQIGSTTNDLSPSDYKMVQIDVECSACKNFQPISVTGRVAPKNLETASNNGALFIKVFDASGNPVSGADVHVQNIATTSTIIIDDETNNSGMLQIVDTPPGVKAYRITVSKSGYSISRTYPVSSGNPNPISPDATVINQQVTQVSFVIDKLSSIKFSTLTAECLPVGSVPFTLSGAKLIGTSPDVFKFNGSYTTDVAGERELSSLEWDTFSLNLTSSSYYLAGTNPPLPFSILPDSGNIVSMILTSASPSHLLVTVLDGATSLPVSGASVDLTKSGFAGSALTGRGYLEQSDWSGGAGQTNFITINRYFSDDGNMEITSPSGDLKLKSSLGVYATSGVLTSSVFDTGTSSNFGNIFWSPISQPAQAGVGSVKFQVATAPDNNASTTWDFIGPDGTAGTYYSVSDTAIDPGTSGDRYFRYKIFLSTIDSNYTPLLASVAVTFTSGCIPPGQTIFSDLTNGSYTLDISKSGYASQSIPVSINSSWKNQNVVLLAN